MDAAAVTAQQLDHESLRYAVECTFGSQVHWFNVKMLRYNSLAKAYA